MIKVRIFDHITRKVTEVEVPAKVAHYLEKLKKERNERIKLEKENGLCSLDELIENGFQPIHPEPTLDDQIIIKDRERKYFNSPDYRHFRKSLNREIKNKYEQMGEKVGTAMYLRFSHNMSIGQIAKVMHCSKSTAQTYLSRGTSYIKDFLNDDIKEQERIERRKQQEAFKKFLEFYNKKQ